MGLELGCFEMECDGYGMVVAGLLGVYWRWTWPLTRVDGGVARGVGRDVSKTGGDDGGDGP